VSILLEEIARHVPAIGSRNWNNADQTISPPSGQKTSMDSPSCGHMATVGDEMQETHSLMLHPESILSSSDIDKKTGEVTNELHDLVSKVYKNTLNDRSVESNVKKQSTKSKDWQM